MFKKSNLIIWSVSILISVVSLCIILFYQLPSKKRSGEGEPPNLSSQPIGGNFSLKNFDNQYYGTEQLKGKFSLVYFGFSFCPDVCPESLSKFSKVKNVLAKYGININVVFITIDPKRDTVNVLKEYLAFFHKDFIGLTGTEKEIANIAQKFKVYYTIIPEQDPEHYMIDHSSFSYIINPKGDFIKLFYLKSSAEEIVDFILIESRNQKNP